MATEIKLTGDNSELIKSIQETIQATDKLGESFKEVEEEQKKAFLDGAKDIDKNTKSLKDNLIQAQKHERNVDSLKKGTTEYTKALGKQGKEVSDINKRIDELLKAQNKATDPKKVREYTNALKKEKEQLDKILKTEKEIGSTDGVGKVSEGFSGLSGVIGGDPSGVGSLIGGAGKAIPFVAAASAAAELGKEVFNIAKEFQGLRGEIQKLTDQTGAELDNTTVRISALASTFEEDTQDILLAQNALMNEFNISSSEALDFIENGFLSAANAQGDLLDNVKEYSSQFANAEGSAQQFLSVLSQTQKEGIFSDKGIDVVKEFNLRIREQTTATRDALNNAFGEDFTNRIFGGINDGSLTSVQALKLISAEMNNTEIETSKLQTVIADVFGGAGEDAGLRYIQTLSEIGDNYSDVVNIGSEYVANQQAQLEADEKLAEAKNELSKMFTGNTEVAIIFKEVMALLIEQVTISIENISALVTDLYDMFDIFGKLREEVKGGLTFWERLENQFRRVGRMATRLIPFGLGKKFQELVGLNKELDNQLSETYLQEKRVAEAREEMIGIVTEETGRLKNLITFINAETTSKEEKKKAIDLLQVQYGQYLKNIDLEADKLNGLKEVYNAVTAAIIDNAAQKLIQTKQQDVLNSLINEQVELEKLREEGAEQTAIDEQIKKIDELSSAYSNIPVTITLAKTKVKTTLEGIPSDLERINQEIERANKRNRELILDGTEAEILAQNEIIKALRQQKAELEGSLLPTETEAPQVITSTSSGSNALKDQRKKDEQDFQNAINQIIQRGEESRRKSALLSEEERIENEKRFQLQELQNLYDFIEEKNRVLNGQDAQLDPEVSKAFNAIQEQIEVEHQNKIIAIQARKAQERIAQQQSNLQTELQILDEEQKKKIALLDNEDLGEEERAERVKAIQVETLNFKNELIQEELNLKLQALDLELEAIQNKEDAESAIKRQGLEDRKKLLELQANNQIQANKKEIEGLTVVVQKEAQNMGELFDNLKEKIAGALGLNTEQLQSLANGLKQVASQIFSFVKEGLQTQIDSNQELLTQLGERKSQIQSELELELEAHEQGFASNVEAKRKELDEVKRQEELALKEKERLAREREKIETLEQTMSLITSSANIVQSFSSLPLGIGIALSAAVIASMFAAFAATKSKARNATQLEKGGFGDNYGVVTGKRHYQGGEAFTDHIELEQGEAFSVYNRKSTKKYGKKLLDFTNAVNSGTMPDAILDNLLYGTGVYRHDPEIPNRIVERGIAIKNEQILIANNDKISKDILSLLNQRLKPETKKETRTTSDGKRQTIITKGNHTKIITHGK